MGFLQKIWSAFSKNRKLVEAKKARFILKEQVLESPELCKEAAESYSACTPLQKRLVNKIVLAMQSNIDYHVGALFSFDSTLLKIKEDKKFVTKSCFEAMMIQWAFLSQAFNMRGQKIEPVKSCLWWLTSYSFSEHECLFRESNYKGYDDAFQYDVGYYWGITEFILNPGSNSNALYSLFERIMRHPLSRKQQDVSEFMWQIEAFPNDEKRMEVLSFIAAFVENAQIFNQELIRAFL